jgi:hypothetical protein
LNPLAPYEEFEIGANTYYFTPGGFLTVRTWGQRRWEASFVAT